MCEICALVYLLLCCVVSLTLGTISQTVRVRGKNLWKRSLSLCCVTKGHRVTPLMNPDGPGRPSFPLAMTLRSCLCSSSRQVVNWPIPLLDLDSSRATRDTHCHSTFDTLSLEGLHMTTQLRWTMTNLNAELAGSCGLYFFSNLGILSNFWSWVLQW